MTHLVVTGFGPFPQAPFNFSKLVVNELTLDHPSVRLTRHIYDTEYAAVDRRVREIFDPAPPAAIIGFGIGHPDGIFVESLARNNGTDPDEPDASGKKWDGPIDAAGPDTLPATLPLDLIYRRLFAGGHGIDLYDSDDAGGYVCNFAFFKTALAAQRLGGDTAVGFFHLPGIAENDVGGAYANALRKAVDTIVGTVADWIGPQAGV